MSTKSRLTALCMKGWWNEVISTLQNHLIATTQLSDDSDEWADSSIWLDNRSPHRQQLVLPTSPSSCQTATIRMMLASKLPGWRAAADSSWLVAGCSKQGHRQHNHISSGARQCRPGVDQHDCERHHSFVTILLIIISDGTQCQWLLLVSPSRQRDSCWHRALLTIWILHNSHQPVAIPWPTMTLPTICTLNHNIFSLTIEKRQVKEEQVECYAFILPPISARLEVCRLVCCGEDLGCLLRADGVNRP